MDNKPKGVASKTNKGWKGLISKKAHSRTASGNIPEEATSNTGSEATDMSSSPPSTNSPQTPVSRGRSRTVTRTASIDEGEKLAADEYSLAPITSNSTRKSIQSFHISNIFLAGLSCF